MSKRSKLSMIVGSGDAETRSGAGEFRKKTFRLREFAREAAGMLARGPDVVAIWGLKRMDPAFREEIMVAVARANQCRYCNFVHSWWAARAGLAEESLARISVADPTPSLDPDNIAVAYVQALAQRDFRPVGEELTRLLADRYSERERADIELVARAMTLFNRSANTFDALLSRTRGVPSRHSSVVDELVLGSALVLVAPAMVAALSVLQRKTPLRLAREFQAFSDKFEEEIASSSKSRLRAVKPNAGKGRASA